MKESLVPTTEVRSYEKSRAGKEIAARIFDSVRTLTRLLGSRGR